MNRNIIQTFVLISLLFCAIGIQSSEKLVINHLNWNPKDVSLDNLNQVRSLKIMFGHQSVGTNIVDGLVLLGAVNPIRYDLDIKFKPTQLTSGSFGHWKNGENQDPHGKIRAFNEKLRSQAEDCNIWGNTLDVAYFKLCYVDLNLTSINVDDLFNEYCVYMNNLIMDFPNCKIVHVTMPISALIYGSDKERNKRRYQFNEKIISYVDSTENYLFDIADIESHDENGVEQTFEYEGNHYPMMWYDENDPENNGWSYDGGHLNDKGKERMALAMWSLWAALVEEGSTQVDECSRHSNLPPSSIHINNFPNPFNPATTLKYEVNNAQLIKIDIFNLLGHHIETLVNQFHNEGVYSVKFNGNNLTSGTYLYRIQGQGIEETNRMMLIK